MERKQSTIPWVRGNCIGKGSFGAVHLASSSNGAVFAVKSATADSPQAESLETEIQLLSSLSSPYVVNYLGDDVSVESGVHYRNLHMEYLSGGTAADLLLSTAESVLRSFTRCVVSALSYVHSRGITHCDVKGRNVLIGQSPGSAKLADFGSAIGESDSRIPRGSPLWMAPEVVRREYQGPESDVWSLGCTVIEMVTGKPAWEDRGLETLTLIGYSSELPRFPTGLSESGLDFLDKCLKREPDLRWTCNQLLLHPFLSSVSPTTTAVDEPSPRCVIDWFGSDSDEEESVEPAKQRIGKLVDEAGANWESEDGWGWVRGSPDLQPEQLPNDTVDAKYEARFDSSWISRRAVSEEASSCRGSGGPRDDLLGGPDYWYGPLKEAVEMIGRVGLVGLGLVVFGPFCNLWPLFYCIGRCSSYLLPITVMMILRKCRCFRKKCTFSFAFSSLPSSRTCDCLFGSANFWWLHVQILTNDSLVP